MMIVVIIVKRSGAEEMRITKDQARDNRERALAAAARLFREKGFGAVGVDEVMRAAGLTHGGFYNHFASREAIEAEACAGVFARSLARIEAIAGIADAAERARAFADYRRRYVSPLARDAPAASCPMVAFAGDVSRRPAATRKAYAEGLARYLDAFARASGRDPADVCARGEAIREFSALVGALTLARSIAGENPELSDAILRAAGEKILSSAAERGEPTD